MTATLQDRLRELCYAHGMNGESRTAEALREAATELSRLESACESAVVEIDRLRESARQLAIVSARDQYLCGLLVDWSVRANGGEDHGMPPEHILRTLIRQLDLHQAANPALLGALERAGDDPLGFIGER